MGITHEDAAYIKSWLKTKTQQAVPLYLHPDPEAAQLRMRVELVERWHEQDTKQLATVTAQRDELARKAERALEAWDTTCLHAPSDQMMQERMETLRAAIESVKEKMSFNAPHEGPTARLYAQVGSTDGLVVAAPSAPTFEGDGK